jgi:hypothetical protein
MWCTRLTEQYGLEVSFVSSGIRFVGMPRLVAEEMCFAAGENVIPILSNSDAFKVEMSLRA